MSASHQTSFSNCSASGVADGRIACISAAGPAVISAARKIQVLFVIDQLTVLGGGERAMLQMISGLSERFECSVLTFREDVHPEVYALLRIPLNILPIVRTWSVDGVRAALKLRRFIREQRFDVVHTFFETADLFGGVAAKAAGVKAVISSRRDMGLLRSRKHKVAYRVMGGVYSRVLAVSNAVRTEVLKRDGLHHARVTTLYTGVLPAQRLSEEALLALRRRLGIPDAAPVVATVANILPWKGHHEFLQAASIVREHAPDVHFVVAGAVNDERLFKTLVATRADLGMQDCFHYLGEVRPAAPLFQLASVFCLLSKTEGLPNVVLQAMAAGTPVVATRVGGTAELVHHGVTGFLVNASCAAESAARICELLFSPERARQMAEAGRRRASTEFSMTKMLRSLEEIYVACLAG